MSEPHPESNPAPTLTAEQQDTVRLLNRLFGKTFADRYSDFCLLVRGEPKLHASIPLAAHAMRELESMLRSTLVGPMEAALPVVPADDERLRRIEGFLKQEHVGEDDIERALKALQPRRDHADEIKAIASRLGFAADADVTKKWINLSRMAGRAHKRSFHEELEVDDTFRQEFQKPFDLVVRSVALALEGRYSAFLLRVNELADMPDAGKSLKLFEAEIPGAPNLQWHFFHRIMGPQWLKPLLRSRFVREPQLKLPDAGQGARSRDWPIGTYLQRMATNEDASVRALAADALRIVSTSRHPDVRDQGIRILAELPAADAATLCDVLVGWLDDGIQHAYLDKPVKMLVAFADNGFKDAAFKVARAVFQLLDHDGAIGTLHSQHMYEHYLPQAVESLGPCDGKASVGLFAELLIQAALITRKLTEENDRTEHTPHPLVDSQMATYDVYDALVVAVRDSAYLSIKHAPADAPEVIRQLFDRGPRILKRIALQVLSQSAALAPHLAVAYLSSKDLIGASWCEDEYAELAKAWFPSLAPGQRDEIFATIDALPDQYGWWPERFEAHEGRPPSDDDMSRFRHSVIRDAMWLWREVLPQGRREALDALVMEVGDPDVWRNQYFRESVSPMSGDEFAARSIEEIVAFLKSWHPQAEPVRQTVSALGQQLQSVVQQTPERFVVEATQFADLRPIYVRRVLEGLDASARTSKGFSWDKTLGLIKSTIARTNVDAADAVEGDDKDWQWAAFAAADLLKTLLRRADDALSNNQLPRIIHIIEVLAKVAPRSSDSSEFEDEFKKHPSFTAERTLRGSVAELCMLFLYWAAKREGAPLKQAPRTAMDHYGQISALLDSELADASPAGRIPRAVLGRYLRNVNYFGENWLRANMQRLFPPNDPVLRDAAWSGHLLNDAGPLGPVMSDLVQSYEHEISRLSLDETTEEKSHRANRLSEYLVILYVNGIVATELIEKFWKTASDRLRQHAMWFLGRDILAAKDIEPEALDRGRSYWEERLGSAQAANDKSSFEKEIGAIGQWMHAEGIDDEWLAVQLLRVVRAGIEPNNGYFVIEWLGKRAPVDTDRAVETLAALLAIPNLEPSLYVTYRDSLRTILAEGRNKGLPATIDRINEIINRMASHGESGYLDMLTPRP
jgi:hypothetical protein